MANVIETLLTLKDEATAGLKKFDTTVKGASVSMAEMGVKAGLAGAAITGALGLMANSAVSYAAGIARASEQSGVASESLSKLGYIAEQKESSLEALNQAFKFLGKSMSGAKDDAGAASDVFRKLDVDIKTSSGGLRETDAVFMDVMRNFSKLGSEGEKTAGAMTLFGRAGYSLKPMLNTTGKEIDSLSKDAERLGIVLSDFQSKALDQVEHELANIKKGYIGVAVAITTQFLPEILTGIYLIKNMYMSVVEWIGHNKEATKTIIEFAAGVGVALTIFSSFMLTIATIVGAVSILTSAWGLLTAGFTLFSGLVVSISSGLFAIVASIMSALGTLVLAFPIFTAIVLAIALISSVAYKFRKEIGDYLNGIWTDAKTVGGFLIDIIAKIFTWLIEGIGKLGWVGEKFTSMFTSLKDGLITIGGAVKDVTVDAGEAIADGAAKGYTAIVEKMANLKAAIVDKVSGIGDSIKAPFAGIMDSISGMFGTAKTDAFSMLDELKTKVEEVAEVVPSISEKFLEGWASAAPATKGIWADLGASMRNVYESMYTGFGQSIAKMMRDGTDLGKSMKAVFNSMADAIIATIVSMAAKTIVEETLVATKVVTLETVKGQAKAMTAHMGIPFVGFALGAVAAIALLNFMTGIAKFGDGGIVSRPTLAIVGEKGPERITPLAKENNSLGTAVNTQSQARVQNVVVNMGGFNFTMAGNKEGDVTDIMRQMVDKIRSETIDGIRFALVTADTASRNEARSV